MNVVLTILSGVLKIVFSLSVLGLMLSLPIILATGIIGLITKEYKYFRLALKIGIYILVAFVGSVLLTSAITFIGTTLGG